MVTIDSEPNLYAPTGLSEPNPSWFVISTTTPGWVNIHVVDNNLNGIGFFVVFTLNNTARFDVITIAKALCDPYDVNNQLIPTGGYIIDDSKRFAVYKIWVEDQNGSYAISSDHNIIWAGVAWNDSNNNGDHSRYVIFDTDLGDPQLVDFEEVDYSYIDFA